MAGSRNGLDRSEPEREAIRTVVAELEALNPSSEPAGESATAPARLLCVLRITVLASSQLG